MKRRYRRKGTEEEKQVDRKEINRYKGGYREVTEVKEEVLGGGVSRGPCNPAPPALVCRSGG